MPEIDATTSKQVQDFLNANGGIAVVDCHATWCGPCKAIAPYVHKKSGETGIPLIKVDVDQAPELSSTYKVEAMPTFLVVKGQWNNIVGNKVVGGGQKNVDTVFATAASNK